MDLITWLRQPRFYLLVLATAGFGILIGGLTALL